MKIKYLPQEIKELALLRQKEQGNKADESNISSCKQEGGFDWCDTYENKNFWNQIFSHGNFSVYYEKYGYPNYKPKEELNTPKYYNNEKGTLYKIASERGWNPYLFDIVKRLERAEKKGEFKTDLEKSINVIRLWLSEAKTK